MNGKLDVEGCFPYRVSFLIATGSYFISWRLSYRSLWLSFYARRVGNCVLKVINGSFVRIGKMCRRRIELFVNVVLEEIMEFYFFSR